MAENKLADLSMDFPTILLGILLTAIAYMAFPLVRLIVNKGKFSKKSANKIALWNSIIIGLVFCVATIMLYEGNISWNAAPAVLYYWINVTLLTDKNANDKTCPLSRNEPSIPFQTTKQSESHVSTSNNLSFGDYSSASSDATINREKSEQHENKSLNKKTYTKKQKIAFACICTILGVVTVVVLLSFYLIIPNSKYKHAQSLLEAGQYDLAYLAFEDLENFSNSKEKLLETRYLQAVSYRDKGDYEIANKIFKELGYYRDSIALIHIHDYKRTKEMQKTCTTNGSESFECTSCNKSYTIITDASHNYKPATCTTPRTCLDCGKTDGIALGHSHSTICSRCGKNTFDTLYYSGTGSDVINLTLPKGKFRATVKMTSGKSSVDVNFHYIHELYEETYEWFNVSHAGNSEVEIIDTVGGTCSIVVNANTSYNGQSSWKITIEALG